MKKTLLGVILAAGVLVLQPLSAMAAPSRTAVLTPVGDSVSYYDTDAMDTQALEGEVEETVLELIDAINEGNAGLEDLAEAVPELAALLEGKSALTLIFDLYPVNGGQPLEDGSHRVTLSVPSLTEDMTEVGIIHYSVERGEWEYIEPEHVDYENKEITAVYPDLSPIMVVAKVAESASGEAVGTAPKTGVSSHWELWLGAGAVLLAAAALAYRKARA